MLFRSLSKYHEVIVVAPHTQKSASSHSLTISGSLKVKEMALYNNVKSWAVYGTPADCVHLAIKRLLDERPDMIISGINQGFNISSDCIYSGTVAAAREGFILGVPAIAVSLDSFTSTDFAYAAEVARHIAERFIDDEHNLEYMLNVNVPSIPTKQIKGYKVCEFAGIRDYDEYFTHTQDADYHYFEAKVSDILTRLKGDGLEYDYIALKADYVTITPLDIDLVNHQRLTSLANKWDDQF